MKNKLSIQQRLILPIILLGAVALISNILSVFSVNNVNSNASKIVDNYMVGSELLQNIRHTTTNIHKMALSHIVATDYDTMISVVAQIKEQEEILEAYLEEYEKYVAEDEKEIYSQLLNNYDSFNILWSILYVPVQTARRRTRMPMQMVMWRPLARQLKVIRMSCMRLSARGLTMRGKGSFLSISCLSSSWLRLL